MRREVARNRIAAGRQPVEGVVPPVVRQPVFAIRLRSPKVFTLDDYEAAGILTGKEDISNRMRQQQDFALAVSGLSHAQIIRAAVRERKNILVVGATDLATFCTPSPHH